MSDLTPEDVTALINKIPNDPKYPAHLVRAKLRGFSDLQLNWLTDYGPTFTGPELGWLFTKDVSKIYSMCKRLGLRLQPSRRKTTGSHNAVRPILRDESERYIRGEGIGSTSSGRVAQVDLPRMPEPLRSYKPEKIDYDAGWWINNAILYKMGLKKLGPDGCSWIDGDTNTPDYKFCGKLRTSGCVYCEDHLSRVHTKLPGEKNNDDQSTDQVARPGPAGHAKARVRQDDARAKGPSRRSRRGRNVRSERIQESQKARD